MNSLKDVYAAAESLVAEAEALRAKKNWDDQDKWQAAHVRSELERLGSLAEKYRRQEKLRRELDAPFLSQNPNSKDDSSMTERYTDDLTLGEKLLGSKQFRGWFKTVAPEGRISDTAQGLMSPPVNITAA